MPRKKSTKKKSASKKRTVKKAAKNLKKTARKPKKYKLINAPEQRLFWVCDGRVLRNLKELASALEEMSEDAYEYHANKLKNDFSNWVRDVLEEPRLATALQKAKTKKEAAKKIKDKLKRLK